MVSVKKKWIVLILALLLVLVAASVPRVRSRETVPVENLENGAFPALWDAYRLEQEQYGLIPEGTATIVTVGNLWGSARYGFLPCVYAQVNTVPENGDSHWATRLCMVQAVEGSALVKKLVRTRFENVKVHADPGEDTMLSSKAGIDPAGTWDHETGWAEIECPASAITSAVEVNFIAATKGSAQEANQECTSRFTWGTDVLLCGETVLSLRDFTVEYSYISNAS